FPGLNNSKEYFVGATISPYKSYRSYLQAELMIAAHSFDELRNSVTSEILANGMVSENRLAESHKFNNIVLYIVPASYRYNINAFMALGAGIQLKTNITQKNDFENTNDVYMIEGDQEFRNPDLSSFEEGTLKDS